MPELTPDQLPALAKALINLRGEILLSISQATGIRPANLSVWLRGREQVISAKRVAMLLYHLGLEGGRLRQGVLHDWQDSGALEDLKLVATAVFNPAEVVVLRDRSGEFEQTCFLVGTQVLVKLRLEQGVAVRRKVQDVLSVRAVGTFHTPIGRVPDWSFEQTREFLAGLCAERDVESLFGENEAFSIAKARLQAMAYPNTEVAPQGWAELEEVMGRAWERRVDATVIAQVLRAGLNLD